MKNLLKHVATPAVIVAAALLLLKAILTAFTIDELIFPAIFLAAFSGFAYWDTMTRAEISSRLEQEKQLAAEAVETARAEMQAAIDAEKRAENNRLAFAQNIDAFDNYFGDSIGKGGIW